MVEKRQDTINWVLYERITLAAKTVILYTINNHGNTISYVDLLKITCYGEGQMNNMLNELVKSGLIQFNGKSLEFSYKEEVYCLNIQERKAAPNKLKRRAKTNTDKARQKLEQMRFTCFVGNDLEIYKLSLAYDKLFAKSTGKVKTILPPVPRYAKKTRNWSCFQRVQGIITSYGFNPQLYLEAQFKALSKGKEKFGIVCPYPNMLYSSWAIANYKQYAKTHVQQGLTTFYDSEEDIIFEVMKSSHAIVRQTMEFNPEVSELQALLLVLDSLSPLYLAFSRPYLRLISSSKGELSEDLGHVLSRIQKDSKYKNMVKSVRDRVIQSV